VPKCEWKILAQNRKKCYFVPKKSRQRVAQNNMPLFVGRETERAEFQQLLRKKTASLVVCEGRRRIGKSTFVRECAKDADHFLSFEGLAPRPNIGRAEQLDTFAQRLADQTKAPKLALENWSQAFQLLASLLPRTGWTVLLLDEISWMAIGEPDFAGHLKVAWDNLFSQRDRLVLVLCGSVTSWIQENILNQTGFVGRCSWQIHLPPLALPACNLFWRGKEISASEKQKVLSVTGGVPRYLEEIDPAQSAEQNIKRLCFHPGGLLFREFDQIFHDIFSRRAEAYRKVATALAGGPKTVSEISAALDQERGGTLTAVADDLVAAGFVSRDSSFNPLTGRTYPYGVRYRLSDNYLRFYLRCVEPVRMAIEKGLYRWTSMDSLPGWDSLMGLQFENLVLANLTTILSKIDLSNVPILNAGPYCRRSINSQKGCQIDLIIRTRQSLYLFEIKFRRQIDKTILSEVRQKVERLKAPRSLSVRTGLIFQGELHPEIQPSDYFDFLVPFESLLV
jgi:AAA+ ATPase superfamily predicted ATPase